MNDLQPILDAIKERLPIEQVVGQRVQLNRKGGRLWGLCPFHAEKSPSFTVHPELGFFKCFGCGKGGDIITFVREMDGLEFMEAVRLLADQAGVDLPSQVRGDSKAAGKRKVAREALSRAKSLFVEAFDGPLGKPARDYLSERGLEADLWKDFCLGWAPAEKGWLEGRLMKEGFEIEALEESGLIRKNSDRPGFHAHFWDRLMFPVLEPGERMAGFGGRYLPGSRADQAGHAGKYVNSPEGPCFPKRRLLYGLDRLQDGLRSSPDSPIVVTEGYLDVMFMVQAGFTTTVAALGTALTEDHSRRLRRYDRPVVLLFDADVAGQKAAYRAAQVLVAEGVDVRVAILPSEMDPADMVQKGEVAELSQRVGQAQDIIDWRLSTWSLKGDSRVPAVQAKAAQEMAEWIQTTPNPVLEELWTNRACDSLNITAQSLRRLTGVASPPFPHSDKQTAPPTHKENSNKEVLRLNEREIVAAVLKDPSLASAYHQELTSLSLGDNLAKRLLDWCLDQRQQGKAGSLDRALTEFQDQESTSWLDHLRHISAEDFEQVLCSALEALPHNRERFTGTDAKTGSQISDQELAGFQRKISLSPSFEEDPH